MKGYAIEKLVVTSQDNSALVFAFANEQVNPSLNDKLFRFELPKGAQWADLTQGDDQRKPLIPMAEFSLKYADANGEIHNQVAEGASEQEVRDRLVSAGLSRLLGQAARGDRRSGSHGRQRAKKLNIEKFLIFNQQFVTLIKAGLPILKSLDLLADRLADPKLGPHINSVRDEVRHGSLLSDAFEKQGIFPPVYVTTVLAGEKSGALAEVLDRFITYQKTRARRFARRSSFR